MTRERREEYRACLALRHSPGLGPASWAGLLAHYGSAAAAAADAAAWAARGLLPAARAGPFRSGAWREAARAEEAAAQALGLSLGLETVLWTDPDYPALLGQLPDPPLFLYVRGQRALLSGPAVAVVGSRGCTDLGQRLARDIAGGLSQAGVTVVSGMAMGIDRAAHLAALNGPGSTVAVWGTGLDVVYPRNHERLAGYLAEGGCLVSEFGPGTPPHPGNFPVRNRLISGLCLGLVLVEAPSRSGGLITARLALEQGREVYVCIGDGTATFAGCARLAEEGARPVVSAGEVLLDLAPAIRSAMEGRLAPARPGPVAPRQGLLAPPPARPLDWDGDDAFGSESAGAGSESAGSESAGSESAGAGAPRAPLGLEGEDLAVWEALGRSPGMHIDSLARHLGWEIQKVSRILLDLEVRGMARQLPGMRYEPT